MLLRLRPVERLHRHPISDRQRPAMRPDVEGCDGQPERQLGVPLVAGGPRMRGQDVLLFGIEPCEALARPRADQFRNRRLGQPLRNAQDADSGLLPCRPTRSAAPVRTAERFPATGSARVRLPMSPTTFPPAEAGDRRHRPRLFRRPRIPPRRLRSSSPRRRRKGGGAASVRDQSRRS